MSETVDHRRLTELRSLLRAIEDAGWEYARVEMDGVALVVSSDPDLVAGEAPAARSVTTAPTSVPEPDATPEPVAATEQVSGPPPPTTVPDGPVETVTSPTIGLFWRSPKPGAPPFVDLGDSVAAGDTVCIIEVMKLMTHVSAPVAGIITAIHIENGSMVEHGTALIDVAPSDDAEVAR